jgi:outer membrane biosynthesis protein TonB
MNFNFHAYSSDEFLAVADFCKRMAEIRRDDPHRVDATRPDLVAVEVREVAAPAPEAEPEDPTAEEVDPPKKPRGRPKKETTIDATPEPAEEPEAPVEELVEEPAEEKTYTIDDVTTAITTLSEKFSSDRALAVLNEFDARSRKTLDEAKYGAFCKRADELLAGAK